MEQESPIVIMYNRNYLTEEMDTNRALTIREDGTVQTQYIEDPEDDIDGACEEGTGSIGLEVVLRLVAEARKAMGRVGVTSKVGENGCTLTIRQGQERIEGNWAYNNEQPEVPEPLTELINELDRIYENVPRIKLDL